MRRIGWLAILIMTLSVPAVAGDHLLIKVHRISADGVHEPMGTIRVEAGGHGIMLHPDIKGLAPGAHAFHIHQNGDCSPGMKGGKKVAGLAAGGHYGAGERGAAGQGASGHGMHKPAGDLPELQVDVAGHAGTPVPVVSLSLAEIKGRSIMIHAYGETPTDPKLPKGGGARIACGVIGG